MKTARPRNVLHLVADVRVAASLDRVIVVPRARDQRYQVRRLLSDALPSSTPVRLTADGVCVAPQHAVQLLELTGPQLDLRWSADARRFAENRGWARPVHGRVHAEVTALLQGGRSAADAVLGASYPHLDDHQRVNVAAMTVPDSLGLCVFDEQGAGKTVSLICAFDRLVELDQADFALVFAPKSMVPEWERGFEEFTGDLYTVRVVAGTRREKLAALRADANVLVTNFETAASLEDELAAVLRRHGGRAVVVVDESFYVKSLDAQRSQAVRRLRELCRRAFVLCGTPAPNTPHDLVQQFNIVDFGVTFDGVRLPPPPHPVQDAVQAAINARGLYVRHLKADVLPGLPPKGFTRVTVQLQPEQARLYRGALDGLVTDVKATDDAVFQRQLPTYLARRTALLQICSHPAAVAPGYSETPAKLLALDAILEDLIERKGEKVVLWSFYTVSLEALAARYVQYRAVRYDGSVTEVAARREAVRRFQDDDDTRLFIGNPAAAGAGLTLHAARYAIYESLSNQAAHYLQSLDRIHRRGQGRDVEYLVLLCDQTVEVAEYERLTAKERAAQRLLGDTVAAPVTREAFLAELLAAPGRPIAARDAS